MGGSPASPQPALTPAARRAQIMPAVVRPGEPVIRAGKGLQLPRRLPFERWLGIGMQLSAVSTSAAWCLGDWLAYGQNAYTGRYRQAIELTCLDYQTLRNYAWVAKRFALSRRRDTLSFAHHAEVAALAQPEQDYWLRKAEQHQWPVKHLRHQVRASLAERSADHHDQASYDQDQASDDQDQAGQCQGDWASLKLRISPGRLAACQAAADKANLTLHDWATLTLEHASSNVTALATPHNDRSPSPPPSVPRATLGL